MILADWTHIHTLQGKADARSQLLFEIRTGLGFAFEVVLKDGDLFLSEPWPRRSILRLGSLLQRWYHGSLHRKGRDNVRILDVTRFLHIACFLKSRQLILVLGLRVQGQHRVLLLGIELLRVLHPDVRLPAKATRDGPIDIEGSNPSTISSSQSRNRQHEKARSAPGSGISCW